MTDKLQGSVASRWPGWAWPAGARQVLLARMMGKRHQMEPLIDEAWRLYRQTSDPCVVRPSIPILYFGDLPRYAASPLKVITVALNPSHHEFPIYDRFARFRPAADIAASILDPSA